MTLTLVCALTWPGRVIGRANAIPWKIGEDLRRFKALTLGHPVVMGRRTWESLPFKLPGRANLVLSSRGAADIAPRPAAAQVSGVSGAARASGSSGSSGAGSGEAPDRVCASLEEALQAAAAAEGGESVFCIGGARVFAAALPLAGALALTLIHHGFEGDAFFPEFDPSRWGETRRQRFTAEGQGFDCEFLDLRRI